MEKNYDLVIIGTGIIGTSILYHLYEEGFKGKTAVFDKEDAIGNFTTSLSAGAFRNIWSTDINMEMTNYSIKKFLEFEKEIGVPIGVHQHGYLFTYYEDRWQDIVEFKPKWDKRNVNTELLSPEEIEKMVPGIKTKISDEDPEIIELLGIKDIVGGLFGPDCGSFDPSAAAKGYAEKTIKMHSEVEIFLNTEVKRVMLSNGKVMGVELINGEKINASLVIVAAGPYSKKLLSDSGIPPEENIPVEPIKRMLFITNLPPIDGFDKIPLTIIDKGIYFKVESGNLLIGRAKEDQEPGFDTTPDINYYKDEINVYMQERIPGTEHCNVRSMWAGLYSVTMPDHNGILGFHPAKEGLFLAVGWSGHGAMVAPAVGKCAAELIVHGEYRTIDARCLSFERFAKNELIKETIVI